MYRNCWIIILIILLWSSCDYNNLTETPNPCTSGNLSLTIVTVNTSTCSASDGSLTISGTGGVRGYTYSINEEPYQSDSVYRKLAAGNYTVSVKDGKGCITSQIASINNNQTSLKISTSSTANSGCSTPNGSITIVVIDGTNPIQYKLNSGTPQPGNIFTGLTAGTYSVTAIDSTSCSVSGTAIVASSGPSFSSQIDPIISSNCALSGCHNGSRNPNLTSYSSIKANASSIVSAINRNMPPGGKLTAEQIALISCWANDGAPNN
jgi:hypothetical protein